MPRNPNFLFPTQHEACGADGFARLHLLGERDCILDNQQMAARQRSANTRRTFGRHARAILKLAGGHALPSSSAPRREISSHRLFCSCAAIHLVAAARRYPHGRLWWGLPAACAQRCSQTHPQHGLLFFFGGGEGGRQLQYSGEDPTSWQLRQNATALEWLAVLFHGSCSPFFAINMSLAMYPLR